MTGSGPRVEVPAGMPAEVPAVTHALAAFVSETPDDAVPPDVRQRALWTIADTLATAAAGIPDQSTAVLRSGLLPSAGTGASRIVGTNLRTDPMTAALLNAACAHALDFDAISFAVSGFVGSATLSALAALAEDAEGTGGTDWMDGAGGASQSGGNGGAGLPAPVIGRDVVTAYCLGWEAAAAVGRGVNPSHYAKGWHPTATLSHVAATAAAGRLLGLSPDRMASALSIAVSEASGVKTMIGNMLNPFHVGKAARNGVVAARLAGAGFDGNPTAFEARQGFLNLFNGPGTYDADAIVDHLGSRWDLADPGPVMKIYPCCGLMHSGLDAVLGLRQDYGLSAQDVESVTVRVHEYVPTVMHVTEPSTGYQAKFSVPYCTAAAVVDGRCDLATFDNVRPEIARWSERVAVEVHPDLRGGSTFFGEEFTEVVLETRSGSLVRRVPRMENRGTGANVAPEELASKLADCFRHGGVSGDAAAAWQAIMELDSDRPFVLWELAGIGDG